VVAAWRLWSLGSHLVEVSRWIREVLDDSPADLAPDLQAELRYAAGIVAGISGDIGACERWLTEAAALFHSQGNERRLGWALCDLGSMLIARNEQLDRAEELLERGLALRRRLGNVGEIASAVGQLGELARLRGDDAAALAYYEECVALFRRVQDGMLTYNVAMGLHNLGRAKARTGDLTGAAALLCESTELFIDIDYAIGIAHCLAAFGCLEALRDPARAARLLGAAAAIVEDTGSPFTVTDQRDFDEAVALSRGSLEPATWSAEWSAGRAMPPDEVVALALCTDDRPVPAAPRQRDRRLSPS
jgi:tetratricopeptide (TPR) repeat protein